MSEEIEQLKLQIKKLELEIEILKLNKQIIGIPYVVPSLPQPPFYPTMNQPFHYHNGLPCYNNPCVTC
jgi:hypothetical protein